MEPTPEKKFDLKEIKEVTYAGKTYKLVFSLLGFTKIPAESNQTLEECIGDYSPNSAIQKLKYAIKAGLLKDKASTEELELIDDAICIQIIDENEFLTGDILYSFAVASRKFFRVANTGNLPAQTNTEQTK